MGFLATRLRMLRRDESGASPMDYVLLAAGMSVAVTFGAGMVGSALGGVFGRIADALAVPALVETGAQQSQASTQCAREPTGCQ